MKSIYVATLILVVSSAVMAGPTCNAPKDKWMKESDFKTELKARGYQIKTFKVSHGCYEIYGLDKAGKKVEIYFNPVTGLPA